MALEGDLATLSVRDLLGWLAGRRASGILSLTREMAAWQLRLREGSVVVATSSDGASLLGKLLVARRLLDEAQLADALERSRRSQVRLGKTLVRARLVTAEVLAGVLGDQARAVLADLLSPRWAAGRFFFDDAPVEERPGVAAGIDLGAYLADGGAGAQPIVDADVLEVTDLGGRPTAPPPIPAGARRASRRSRAA